MSLKDSWKATGVGLGHAFKDLGKTLVKTASAAVDKAEAWASSEDEKKPQEPETKPEDQE